MRYVRPSCFSFQMTACRSHSHPSPSHTTPVACSFVRMRLIVLLSTHTTNAVLPASFGPDHSVPQTHTSAQLVRTCAGGDKAAGLMVQKLQEKLKEQDLQMRKQAQEMDTMQFHNQQVRPTNPSTPPHPTRTRRRHVSLRHTHTHTCTHTHTHTHTHIQTHTQSQPSRHPPPLLV
jgi:hypothetical protein